MTVDLPTTHLVDHEPATGTTSSPVGAAHEEVVRLDRNGTTVLVRVGPDTLPSVIHWGAAVGTGDTEGLLAALAVPPSDSVTTTQERVPLLPLHSAGWLGRPGLLGHRAGRDWSPAFDAVQHRVVTHGAGADGGPGTIALESEAIDSAGHLAVHTHLELLPSGVLRVRAGVRNTGTEPFEVTHLEPAVPVPPQATELLDFTGRHANERHAQRRPFDIGSWVRESWGGRAGHDAATLLCAGTPGFGYRHGQVWAVHLAASGNQVVYSERTVTDWRLLRGGERLLPGELSLAPGETYTSPWLVASWGEGLDAVSTRLHAMLRERPHHPRRPRPVLLNTWEAAYFQHDVEHLLELAERAAALGVERYVLDDGWFGRRRDDTRGLGDWVVSEDVWPDGLHPLVDRVRELGMEFGLWFEPEMVNLDSALAEANPEWLFQTSHGPGVASRHQHVLDLGHPEAFAHVLGQISALVEEYDIAFLKWDHNRPVIDGGHWPTGHPGVREHANAVLRLMAELKARHPGLEIESCAGGGGRIDLATAEVTDRVWVSDCIDAHERHRLNVATGLLLPPELLGTHIGAGADHSTGRRLGLDFRAGTAMWGHMGIEWDLTTASEDDLARLGEWVALHRRFRGLLHGGVVVHADVTNRALQLDGVVAPDGTEALFKLSMLEHSLVWPPGRVTLPGLDPDVVYDVAVVGPVGLASPAPLPRWATEPTRLSGGLLGTVGLQSPYLSVDELVVIHAVASSTEER
ncbi:alpha-galactosidase [Oryzobacter telluris]|uniref:alpha-galactosidase n=1 Tax=Oryzobacter telluris TaxID=3149179 RepID=UPI00370D0A7A